MNRLSHKLPAQTRPSPLLRNIYWLDNGDDIREIGGRRRRQASPGMARVIVANEHGQYLRTLASVDGEPASIAVNPNRG